MDRAEALGRLARRYLAGYGPANPHDVVRRAARSLIGSERAAAIVAGQRYLLLASVRDGRSTTIARSSALDTSTCSGASTVHRGQICGAVAA